MVKIFNAAKVPFHERQSPIPEFSWQTSPHLADIVQSKHLAFDIRSLDPGKYSYPYHFHRNAEEMFVIFKGKVMLRTPDEFIELVEGDIVFFEVGPKGAHQLYNHTEEPCLFLDIRTTVGLDVCEYPDSGKINILPSCDIFLADTKVGYYTGEEDVSKNWPCEIVNKDKR